MVFPELNANEHGVPEPRLTVSWIEQLFPDGHNLASRVAPSGQGLVDAAGKAAGDVPGKTENRI